MALLEAVTNGMPVVSSSREKVGQKIFFPERKIRLVADFALSNLVDAFIEQATLRSRLINAMLHSGNAKLRLNIFSGLMFLCGRSSFIAQ